MFLLAAMAMSLLCSFIDANAAPRPTPRPIRVPLTIDFTGRGVIEGRGFGGSLIFQCANHRCVRSINKGSVVTLTARNVSHYVFLQFSGDCQGETCELTMSGPKSVQAIFNVITHPLSISKEGNGTVTSEPSGINCGTVCQAQFSSRLTVLLRPSPGEGGRFLGWSGYCRGRGSCRIPMRIAQSVTARFSLPQPTQTPTPTGIPTATPLVTPTVTLPPPPINRNVSVTIQGPGQVTSAPSGLSCVSQSFANTTCSAQFQDNQSITLTAQPAPGSTFGEWGGGFCGGTNQSCTIDLASDISQIVVFHSSRYLVRVLSTPEGGKIVSNPISNSDGINCGNGANECQTEVTAGTRVTVTATPNAGLEFLDWGGGTCGGSNPICAFDVNFPTDLTATFRAIPSDIPITYPVTVNMTESGIVTSQPSGISCPPTCSANFPAESTVVLSAVGPLRDWGGGWCSGTATCTLQMTGSRVVRPVFNAESYIVTMDVAGGGVLEATASGFDTVTCSGRCTPRYPHATRVTFTYTPSSGMKFDGWGGGDCGNLGPCTFTIDHTASVFVSFVPN